MAFCRSCNWAVMAVCGRLLIKVPVGCHGQSSEVVVGHHRRLTMVVLQYFTLPLLVQRIPMDFRRTLPFPMDSVDSLSEVRRNLLDMTGFRCQSGQSPVKVHSNHLEARNGWTSRNSVSVGRLLDFHRISNGQRQKPVILVKFSVQRTSDGFLSKKGTRGC